jgi:hypothetical protein
VVGNRRGSGSPRTATARSIRRKTLLTAIDDHARLSAVLGGLQLSDNAALTDVAPLSLRGSLQVINNASLGSIGFLSLVDPSAIGVRVNATP